MEKDFKILINASKTLDLSKKSFATKNELCFFDKTKIIASELTNLSSQEIAKNFKVSQKIALQTWNYFQVFDQKFFYAIELYKGTVFKELSLDQYDKAWLNEHVLIMDAFYGLLKPYDLICPYRLDFSYKKLSFQLYPFWTKDIKKFLKKFNLYSIASNEYNKLLEDLPFINLNKELNLKTKKQRGQKLHQVLLNKKI